MTKTQHTIDGFAVRNVDERGARWDLLIQIALFLALVGTSTGFGVYANLNRKARTCPLIYDKAKGVVTEAQMKTWASDVGWTLTSPTWKANVGDGDGGCACDADPDPYIATGTSKTAVWVAPCDLRSLFPSTTWPSDFPKEGDDCNPNDHIKVCLARSELDALWTGGPWTNGVKHCHVGGDGEPLQIFTGWDGDLYCTTANPCIGNLIPPENDMSPPIYSSGLSLWNKAAQLLEITVVRLGSIWTYDLNNMADATEWTCELTTTCANTPGKAAAYITCPDLTGPSPVSAFWPQLREGENGKCVAKCHVVNVANRFSKQDCTQVPTDTVTVTGGSTKTRSDLMEFWGYEQTTAGSECTWQCNCGGTGGHKKPCYTYCFEYHDCCTAASKPTDNIEIF